MKMVRRIQRMQMLGDHSMHSRPLSPKNSTQLGASDRNFEFPFQNFGKKVGLFAQCRDVEIAHDPIEMADSGGIESGGKLHPLKGVTWQRREEVLRAGWGGALYHVQITDSGHPFFQCWITGIEIFIDNHFSIQQRISHTTTNFARGLKFQSKRSPKHVICNQTSIPRNVKSFKCDCRKVLSTLARL
jgi:hypothetical protein